MEKIIQWLILGFSAIAAVLSIISFLTYLFNKNKVKREQKKAEKNLKKEIKAELKKKLTEELKKGK